MLYRPSNMIPSAFAGEGMDVIDAATDNVFYAQVNGTSPVLAYQLVIKENTTESATVYDTGMVRFDSPFYGCTYTGEITPLAITVPYTSGMANSFESGYKWSICLWWDYVESSPTSYCVTSTEQFIKTRATPQAAILPFDTPLTTKSAEWSGLYITDTYVPIMWFEWVLATKSDTGYSTVYSTGRLFQNSELKFAYDGLSNGLTYGIKLIIHNQDGVDAESEWNDFEVSYPSVNISDAALITVSPIHGVTVDWGKVQFIEGVTTNDDYKIADAPLDWAGEERKLLYIGAGNEVTFASSNVFSLDVEDNSTHIWQGSIKSDGVVRTWTSDAGSTWALSHRGIRSGLIPYSLQSENRVAPLGTLAPLAGSGGYFEFTITIDGVATTYRFDTSSPAQKWFTVIMTQRGLTVYENDAPAGLWTGGVA